MVKNEQDVIGPWVQHLLDEQFAGVIVADNMSTDDTRVILDQFTDPRLHVMDDPEVGYYQGEKTSRMGQIAAEWGATWIVPVDADEWWFSTRGPIGEVLTDDLPVEVLKTWGYDHRVTSHDDPTDPNPFSRIQWRETVTQKFPKVSYRFCPEASLHLGNHDVDMPGRRDSALLQFRHFGYRSLEQMARKVRQGKTAYEATNLSAGHGAHWREYGALSDEELEVVWKGFVDMPGLVHDPCPR